MATVTDTDAATRFHTMYVNLLGDGTSQGALGQVSQNVANLITDMTNQMSANDQKAKIKQVQLNALRGYQNQIKDKNDTQGKLDLYFTVPNTTDPNQFEGMATTPSFDANATKHPNSSGGLAGHLGSGNGTDGSFTDQHGYAGTIEDYMYSADDKNPPWYYVTTAWNLSNGGISQADAYKNYQKQIDALEAEVLNLTSTSQDQKAQLTQLTNQYNEAETMRSNVSKEFFTISMDIIKNCL